MAWLSWSATSHDSKRRRVVPSLALHRLNGRSIVAVRSSTCVGKP